MNFTGVSQIRNQVQFQQQQQQFRDQVNQEKSQKVFYKNHFAQLQQIFSIFQQNLEKFAGKYKDEINADPNFRKKFNELCDQIGIDPIVSRKTIFSQLGFGDFYNELAMAILDICQKKRHINGGIMQIQDIITIYNDRRQFPINQNDVKCSLKTISILGNGCQVYIDDYVCTVPFQLNDDMGILLSIAQKNKFCSEEMMIKQKNWSKMRFQKLIIQLLKEGLVWKDSKSNKSEPIYFFPSLINDFVNNKKSFNPLLC